MSRMPLVAATCVLFIGQALAQDRLPTIPPEKYDAAQKTAAEEFLAVRKAPLSGPFQSLMYSPELMTRTRAMGDYLRFKSAIGNTLSELVILVTAREWSQDYEWSVHYPIAIKAGIRPDIAEAIADGRRPGGMNDDEAMVYDFAVEVLRYKRVSDATFERVEKRFGRVGVVDLVGITGYYTLLAMELNVARFPAPNGSTPLPRFPD